MAHFLLDCYQNHSVEEKISPCFLFNVREAFVYHPLGSKANSFLRRCVSFPLGSLGFCFNLFRHFSDVEAFCFVLQPGHRQPRISSEARNSPEEDLQREGHLDAPVEELHGLRLQGRAADPESGHPMRVAGSDAQLVAGKSR